MQIVAIWLLAAASVADDSLAEADRLRLTGRYDEAAAMYERLEDPLGVAACREAVGKTAEAEKLLSDLAARSPDNAAALAELARLAFARGDHDAARSRVDSALKANSKQLLARWVDAELLRVAGKLPEADKAYEWFVDYYNANRDFTPDDVRLIGLAAAQYARWHRNSRQFSFLVNTLFPDALKRNKQYWPARLESARLFLEKYNEGESANDLQAGLAINSNAAELHAAKAELALLNFDLPTAKTSIERALAINPRLLWAHQLQADLLLADLRPAEAATVLEKARELNPRDDDTLGRLAAAYGAADGIQNGPGPRMNVVIDEVVNRNPRCGEFFLTLADSFDRMRRFPFAAQYYAESQRRMPQLVQTRGQLGLTLMRLGDEAKAGPILKEAFQIDPFNVRVKNMLEVLDLLSGYATIETDHFVIRFDRGRDELLARHAARYLEDEVYPDLVRRLGFTPPEKSLFEFFSRAKRTSGHGWFSARMVGLPFIHTVGACAGKMVAVTSPNDGQKFHWGRVLKHEFVHVINLQQTHFNIPHWYTEGLAVWHENLPRPASWNEVLAKRLRADKLFQLDDINYGFIRPKNGDDWTLAYCQAELYVEFLLKSYGEDATAKLIASYADNLTTAAGLKRCFGVEQTEFERAYRKFVEETVAAANVSGKAAAKPATSPRSFADLQKAVEEKPDDPDLRAELAAAFLQRGDPAKAREHATAARKLRDRHPLAGVVLARLAQAGGDTEQAEALLQQSLDENEPHEQVLALLVGLKFKAESFAEAERLLLLGVKKLPQPAKWRQLLAKVYLESGEKRKLAAVLTELAESDSDSFPIRKKLAQLSAEFGDHAAAARWAKDALFIDIQDAELHAVLAASLLQLKQPARAAESFESAVQLDPTRAEWRLSLADALLQANRPELAKKALAALLETDANHPGAAELSRRIEAALKDQ